MYRNRFFPEADIDLHPCLCSARNSLTAFVSRTFDPGAFTVSIIAAEKFIRKPLMQLEAVGGQQWRVGERFRRSEGKLQLRNAATVVDEVAAQLIHGDAKAVSRLTQGTIEAGNPANTTRQGSKPRCFSLPINCARREENLLLVVHRFAADPLAIRISSARGHGAALAVGRNDDATG